MTIDPNSITAIATSVYGAATLLLVIQIWRDRVQRERHRKADTEAHKLGELRSAFYEAWGFWMGHWGTVGSAQLDASQVGKQYEAVARLESQLRLNGYKTDADKLGFAVRADIHGIHLTIGEIGTALGLFAAEYRKTTGVVPKGN